VLVLPFVRMARAIGVVTVALVTMYDAKVASNHIKMCRKFTTVQCTNASCRRTSTVRSMTRFSVTERRSISMVTLPFTNVSVEKTKMVSMQHVRDEHERSHATRERWMRCFVDRYGVSLMLAIIYSNCAQIPLTHATPTMNMVHRNMAGDERHKLTGMSCSRIKIGSTVSASTSITWRTLVEYS